MMCKILPALALDLSGGWARGEFPTTLDGLSPLFFGKLSPDFINDQPMQLRRTNDGPFLLYSVGWNGTDDGGIIVRKAYPNSAVLDMENGDWVWADSAK